MQVLLAPAAAKDLDRLPTASREDTVAALERLASDAYGTDIKKLRGFQPPLYRLRVANVRILFREQGEALHVYRIIDRKNLGRTLARIR
jgi:mRNA-degrading endonuclease RelE of RelBE toxin-antitoxin system